MTILNNKKDEIQIVIRSTSPSEEKDIILKALIASVRWFGNNDLGCIKNIGNVDLKNLVVLSNLMDDMIDTKTID